MIKKISFVGLTLLMPGSMLFNLNTVENSKSDLANLSLLKSAMAGSKDNNYDCPNGLDECIRINSGAATTIYHKGF